MSGVEDAIGEHSKAGEEEPELAVELVDAVKTFDQVRAVDHVTLSVRAGEFLSLLGPSGCGKTTTLRIIAGFEHPDQGRVVVAGEDVTELPPYRRNVNTVFQDYALFPHFTVWENVAYGLRARRSSREAVKKRVGQALEVVELVGFDQRRPAQLSGGQQQRVALARALVLNPRVLLLDEPMNALDRKLRQQMQIELKRVQEDVGISFIFVTHDQDEAFTMSDRVAVMSDGKIAQLGTPRQLYESSTSSFVAEFVGDSNLLRGVVVSRDSTAVGVDVGAGTVVAMHDSALDLGSSVTVMVRPESVVLAHEGQEANGISGTVERMIYNGPVTWVYVSLLHGQVVKVRRERAALRAGKDLNPGDRVVLSWSPADARILVE